MVSFETKKKFFEFRPLRGLSKGDLLGICHSFLSSKCVVFFHDPPQPCIILHNWILTTETILVLAACS